MQEKRARLEWHFDDPVYGFMPGSNGVPSIGSWLLIDEEVGTLIATDPGKQH